MSIAFRPVFQIRLCVLLSLLVLSGLAADTQAWDLVDRRNAIRPQDFGADGTDKRDDTAAFQAAVNAAARAGKWVMVPAGTYYIDANANATWGTFGGIALPGGSRLFLEANAVLQALPSTEAQSAVLRIQDVQDVVVEGAGRIRGERHQHRGKTGEWGMGLFIFGARQVRIEGIAIEACWGDGIYVGHSDHGYAEDIEIRNILMTDNRRQGISVVSARRVLIEDVRILNTGGTPPAAGIDLEPDNPARPNEHITIRGGYFSGNAVDLLMVHGNRNVLVEGPTMRSKNGVVIRDGSEDVRITGADIHITGRGPETAAIQVIASDPRTVRGLEFVRNTLRGGDVILDLPYRNLKGIRVTENVIVKDRADQRTYRLGASDAVWVRNQVRGRR